MNSIIGKRESNILHELIIQTNCLIHNRNYRFYYDLWILILPCRFHFEKGKQWFYNDSGIVSFSFSIISLSFYLNFPLFSPLFLQLFCVFHFLSVFPGISLNFLSSLLLFLNFSISFLFLTQGFPLFASPLL